MRVLRRKCNASKGAECLKARSSDVHHLRAHHYNEVANVNRARWCIPGTGFGHVVGDEKAAQLVGVDHCGADGIKAVGEPYRVVAVAAGDETDRRES